MAAERLALRGRLRHNLALMSPHSPGLPPSKLQFDAQGRLRHLLTIDGLGAERIRDILDSARLFEAGPARGARKVPLLRGTTIVNMFFEASTRTRTSFSLAAERLSADVMHFDAGTAALLKGESLLDTLKTLQAMGAGLFVVRHPQSGAAAFIANCLDNRVAVVNAGDGQHAHPTQALLDMFTIRELKRDFEPLCVAIVGDVLHSRVARSEIAALAALGTREIRIVGPRTLLPPATEEAFGARVFADMREGLEGADVIMLLRLQKERMQSAFIPDEREYYRRYGLTPARLARAKPDALVMHPGPINRGVEISSEVADGPQSAILKQVGHGVSVRMAVMALLLGGAAGRPRDDA